MLHSFCNKPRYKYGFEVPCNEIAEAPRLEIASHNEYATYKTRMIPCAWNHSKIIRVWSIIMNSGLDLNPN